MLNSVAHKSSSKGTFLTKQLIATIVTYGMLRVKYVKHDDGLETFHKLNVNMLNYCQYKDLYQELKGKEILTADVDLVATKRN